MIVPSEAPLCVFVSRWRTNPILGLVCAGRVFLGFLPGTEFACRTSTGPRPSVGVEHVGKHPEHVSAPQRQAAPENVLTPSYAVLRGLAMAAHRDTGEDKIAS
jgi:hypothetical protein